MTTSRPTDGVDVYFEKPVDDTEHANFLRAKTDLEERRMLRINKVTFKESLCRWHLKHLGHQSGGRVPRLASSVTPIVHGAQSTCKETSSKLLLQESVSVSQWQHLCSTDHEGMGGG